MDKQILLTHSEIRGIVRQMTAIEAPIEDMVQEGCRAQVRKVADEIAPRLKEILEKCHDIRMDWTDPRHEINEIGKAVVAIESALNAAGEGK